MLQGAVTFAGVAVVGSGRLLPGAETDFVRLGVLSMDSSFYHKAIYCNNAFSERSSAKKLTLVMMPNNIPCFAY